MRSLHININNIFMKNNYIFQNKKTFSWEEKYCFIFLQIFLISGLIKNSLNFISAFAFSLVHCHPSRILWKSLGIITNILSVSSTP